MAGAAAARGSGEPRAQGGRRLRVLIIGAGAGGLAMAARLLEQGFTEVRILERAASLGGTWRDNTYPGSGCDVPSHLYCFSFEPNPDWSRGFAEQPEILAYLQRMAERRGLLPLISFNTAIVSARFLEGSEAERAGASWVLTSKSGAEFTADIVISAVGQLSCPAWPSLPGRSSFEGLELHTAQWDPSCSIDGKHVGVIGSGASAIQLVPELAPRAAKLSVFQRSPSYIIPKPDREYFSLEKYLFRRFPRFRRLHRYHIFWALESRILAFRPGLANRLVHRAALKHLADQVKDPTLRRALTPDYQIGCKRILISNDYYPAVASPNVELVTSGIQSVNPHGIATRDGRQHDLDVLIYATGFKTTEFLSGIELIGAHGQRLRDRWRDGAEAFRGVAVSGFPNLFMLYGPNTNLGHNSILFMLECQVEYILALLCQLDSRGLRTLDVRRAAEQNYNQRLQAELATSVWNTGCGNWYSTPEGKLTNNWSGVCYRYHQELQDRSARHFQFR